MSTGHRPLRLLLVTDCFSPVVGGGERHALDLSRALATRGVELTVVTRRVSTGLARVESFGSFDVRRIGPTHGGVFARYGSNLPLAGILWGERQAYDAILVCGFRFFGVTAAVAGRRLAKPVILRAEVEGELSGAFVDRRGGGRLRLMGFAPLRPIFAARRRSMLGADAFVAVSEPVAREFLDAGVESRRVHVIPNGTDLSVYEPADPATRRARRSTLGLEAGAQIVVYTGKLNRYKGLECLLDAWAQVDVPDARLVLVGSGAGQTLSIEPELRARAATHSHAESILFAGQSDDVPAWLGAADLLVMPSEAETFGISVLEAMASSVPVVASDIPSLAALLEGGEAGTLVDVGNPLALAAGIRRVLTDRDLAERHARAGLEAAKSYGIEAVTDRYMALLETLVGRPVAGVSRPPARSDEAASG